MKRLRGQVVVMFSQLEAWRSTLEQGPDRIHRDDWQPTDSLDPARQQRARLALLADTVLPFLVFLRGYLASRALWYDEAMLAQAVLADPRTLAALPYTKSH